MRPLQLCCLLRYEEEVALKTTAENEFMVLKKVMAALSGEELNAGCCMLGDWSILLI